MTLFGYSYGTFMAIINTDSEFSVSNSLGTSFIVPLTVSNSDGVDFDVSTLVSNSVNTDFDVSE